ncbi:MAG: hypothetical protein ACXQT3_01090 [Methermicoccaceae archaeon]
MKRENECCNLCPIGFLINAVYSPEATRHIDNAKREMLLAVRALAAKYVGEERGEVKKIEVGGEE